ncbi:MAG: undecaprenyl-diphosphate phosphatase [Synergistaceae bacterium]|jgi:undecaprenyl-diphosphatase|nr:undecaprenyl-diphosphate phosphatase [Synergistaceae bacterium]
MNAETLLLGLLQGVTEFLPVSSSGHLALAKAVTGHGEMSLAFDLVLHLATLLASFFYFFHDIASILLEWLYGFINANARRWLGWRFGWAVILGTLVTGPIGIFLKPLVNSSSDNMLILGGNFLITGALLLSSKFFAPGDSAVSARHGIFVGLLQGLSVFPGVSRSGATIWAGRLSGLSGVEAFRFSFLLSMPAILGASLYEAKDLGGLGGFLGALPSGWFPAALAAFASGLASLTLLRRLVEGGGWWFFSLYCIALGCAVVVYSIIGV